MKAVLIICIGSLISVSAFAASLVQSCKSTDGKVTTSVTYDFLRYGSPVSNVHAEVNLAGEDLTCVRDQERELQSFYDHSGSWRAVDSFYFRCLDKTNRVTTRVGVLQRGGYALLPMVYVPESKNYEYRELNTGAYYDCTINVESIDDLHGSNPHL